MNVPEVLVSTCEGVKRILAPDPAGCVDPAMGGAVAGGDNGGAVAGGVRPVAGGAVAGGVRPALAGAVVGPGVAGLGVVVEAAAGGGTRTGALSLSSGCLG